jgi:CHAT domain-containing protein
MSEVPRAVAVRYLTEERDRVVADVQTSAAEAGYWLGEAGHPAEAAIALESGRAISLTEVLGRDLTGVEAALRRAGHPGLVDQYAAALGDYNDATIADSGRVATQAAWAGYEAVVREIAKVADVDLPGAPPELDDLTEAAAEGPVIYLAAADRSGYAIIVPPSGPPMYAPLPRLSRDEVIGHFPQPSLPAGDHDRSTGAAVTDQEIAATARWLWDSGIEMISQMMPAGALVTIVPVGQLSLLPVHAAGGPTAPGQSPEQWTYLSDRVTVRYAPNARALLRTRARADALPPETLKVLAVAAPDAIPERRLPSTRREVSQIATLWGARSRAVLDGAYQEVEQALNSFSVWHFACHCSADPERVLDSALLLNGAELSLRTILALPPTPRRLAILSACETHLADSQVPDEAMSLPTGLLHAGFAGAIASHWPVNDFAAAFLMTRFHELWLNGGLTPAAALAEAQRWLRTATRADLVGYRRGSDRDADRPFAHPRFWAAFALTGH